MSSSNVARPKVQNHESHGMKQGSNFTSKKIFLQQRNLITTKRQCVKLMCKVWNYKMYFKKEENASWNDNKGRYQIHLYFYKSFRVNIKEDDIHSNSFYNFLSWKLNKNFMILQLHVLTLSLKIMLYLFKQYDDHMMVHWLEY